MAVFNNGSITASVTPPQGFTGTYQYSLFKYNSSNGTWELVNGAAEGFTGTFINPTSTVSTTHVFGNPGGYDENKEGDPDSWVGLTPGNYRVEVEALNSNCPTITTDITVGTQDPADPEFTCDDTSIAIANGTAGDAIPTSAVTATGVSNVTAVYATGTTTPATYVDGTQAVDVVFEVPAGYSNTGDSFTCSVDATGSVALAPFLCSNTSITIANGTTGDTIPTSAVTATGVSNIIAVYAQGTTTPATYIDGTQEVHVVFEVPAGYSNTGDAFTCSVDATGTPALTAFTCTDANFQVADGTTGQDVTATVAAGTLNSVSPAQYTEGSATYTANITVPAGYSNSGETLTTCTDTAVGSTLEERTWYYFHGVDDNWLRMTGGGLLDASSYGLFNNGTYTGTAVSTLTEAMAHYFANSASLSNGMDIGQFEMNESITGNGETTQIVFNELINGEGAALYYLLIPNNSLFTENLVTDNLTIFPYPGLAGNAADRQALQIDGVDYYIYLLQGSASVASRTCSFS